VIAHPGHGSTPPEAVEHYVFEPVHAAPVIALVLACLAVAIVRWKRRTP
jgi:hypothetical protein